MSKEEMQEEELKERRNRREKLMSEREWETKARKMGEIEE